MEPGRAAAAAPARDFAEVGLVPEFASFPEGEAKIVQLAVEEPGFATITPGPCRKA